MKVKVLNVEFDYISSKVKINMQSDSKIEDKISFCFIERRMGAGNKLFIPKKKLYTPIIQEDKIFIDIKLNEEMNFFACNDIWDIYIYNEAKSKYYKVKIDEKIDFKYYIDDYYMVEIKPYTTAENGLSVFCKKASINIKCEKIITENEELHICINKTIVNKYPDKCYIRLKKRIHRFLNYFDENIDLKLNENKVIINKEIFTNKNILSGDVYECVLVIFKGSDYEREIPILANNMQSDYINASQYKKYKAFSNGKKNLSLFFIQNKNTSINDISMEDNKLTINLLNEINGDIKELKLITYKNNTYLREGYTIKGFEFLKDENKITIDLNELSSLVKVWNNQKFIINCIISYSLDNDIEPQYEEVNLQFNDNLDQKEITYENYELKITKGNSNENIFSLNPKKINKKVKIAILGSCYSRAAFASSNFFNPGYKEKYDIALTHFHSSLISVMGKVKRSFEEKYFENLKPINKGYIKADFEKTFFQSLKEVKAEYLIIDIYADAQKGIIIFPDDSIITANVDVEASQLMFNLGEGTKTISSKDINTYLPLWIDAAERFSKEIVKYFNEENIIINYTKAVESYISASGEKKIYDTQIDYIRLTNLITDWMNDYLLYLLPKAKIIDSRSLKYIGFEKNPLGNTPNHYESEYYKEFINALDKIVFKDK